MANTIITSGSTAPISSPRPPARPESSATESGTAAPADTVAISRETAQPERTNPYQGFAEHTVAMNPDAWSKDRTPGEGQVARNDHLEGMLRNQGYSLQDIYKKDEQGQTLMERVAQANGLKNPSLIDPSQSLTLPTRIAPPAEAANQADEVKSESLTTEAYNEGDGAEAAASTEVGRAEDATVTTRAETVGTDSKAKASTTVEEAKGSTITTAAKADGDRSQAEAKSLVGRAEDSKIDTSAVAKGTEAKAKAASKVDEAKGSTITTAAKADGDRSQAEAKSLVGKAEDSKIDTSAVAKGPEGKAKAASKVDEAKGSTITTAAKADGPAAQAEAKSFVAKAEDSKIDTSAVAKGPEAKAKAATMVDEAKGSTITTAAKADGPAAQADAATRVEKAQETAVLTQAVVTGEGSEAGAVSDVGEAKDSRIASEAVGEGPGTTAGAGTFVSDAEGSLLAARAQATGGTAEAYVENRGDLGNGSAEVSAAGSEGAHAEALGVEEARMVAEGGTGKAVVVIDADEGQATLTGQDASARTEGRDNRGSFDIDVVGDAKIEDGGNGGIPGGLGTGNSLDAKARGQDLELRAADSSNLDVAFEGRPGDNFVRGNLPQEGDSSRIDLDLGDGQDRVEVQRGAKDDTMLISKSEGELDLNLHTGSGMDDHGSQTTLIDAGNAALSGRIGGSEGDDLTMIRGGQFGDLKVSGGTGGNDRLVIDLPEGAPIPAVVTKAAESGPLFGLFGGGNAAEGILPEGYKDGDQAISASGYESVVIRQNGQIVGQYGEGELPPEFQQAVDQARSS